jgi:SAM-dependent methyltransferase
MSIPSVIFEGETSRNYEDYLGPFLFEPYAVDLAGRVDFTGVSQVLELACGSGRLTAHIVQQLPTNAAFTATDLSEDMIRLAKTKVPSDRITWAQADMMELPFDNRSQDLVLCQFALMLVPDQQKAFSEIHRILKPGGQLLFSTWTDLDYNKLWAIGNEVLSATIGKSPMTRNPGPFALGNADAVLDSLRSTGFPDPTCTTVTNTATFASAQQAAHGFIYGLPIALFIQKEMPTAMPTILTTLEERLKTTLGDHPLTVPQKALVFQATK